MALVYFSWPIGGALMPLLAWGVLPNHGWRLMVIATTAPICEPSTNLVVCTTTVRHMSWWQFRFTWMCYCCSFFLYLWQDAWRNKLLTIAFSYGRCSGYVLIPRTSKFTVFLSCTQECRKSNAGASSILSKFSPGTAQGQTCSRKRSEPSGRSNRWPDIVESTKGVSKRVDFSGIRMLTID